MPVEHKKLYPWYKICFNYKIRNVLHLHKINVEQIKLLNNSPKHTHDRKLPLPGKESTDQGSGLPFTVP